MRNSDACSYPIYDGRPLGDDEEVVLTLPGEEFIKSNKLPKGSVVTAFRGIRAVKRIFPEDEAEAARKQYYNDLNYLRGKFDRQKGFTSLDAIREKLGDDETPRRGNGRRVLRNDYAAPQYASPERIVVLKETLLSYLDNIAAKSPERCAALILMARDLDAEEMQGEMGVAKTRMYGILKELLHLGSLLESGDGDLTERESRKSRNAARHQDIIRDGIGFLRDLIEEAFMTVAG